MGTCPTIRGIVTGSLPDGIALPNNRSASAGPAIVPPWNCSITASAASTSCPIVSGLSYATFEYGTPELSTTTLAMGDDLTVTCRVRNTSKVDAYETVQLYVQDEYGSLVRPVKELKRFEKVAIKGGETATVTFTINTDDLAFWHADITKKAEKGTFKLWVATDSNSGTPIAFEIK